MTTTQLPQDLRTKANDAWRVLIACIGRKGVNASPVRYQDQNWTRDFVYAAQELLLEIGQAQVVQAHLNNLADRQYPDGRMPIMFLDNTAGFLWTKLKNSVRERRLSFLLKAYFSRDGVGQLSPWTRDSELLFALGHGIWNEYHRQTEPLIERAVECSIYARHTDKALAYVEQHLMTDGLVRGADWRDTRKDLDDKCLLSNNILLCRAYALLGQTEKHAALKARINERFWTGTHYRDYPGCDEYDTLGNAYAILYDIAPAANWDSIITAASGLSTACGFMLNSVTLPPKNTVEKAVMDRVNQFGVVWPFIHGFMIMAMIKAGFPDRARKEFDKWTALPGFFEWYDPRTGNGHGSVDQLWSAALYLRAARALGYQVS